MSRINEPLLRQVLGHIEANPAAWNQNMWICSTTGCLAGWTVALAEGMTLPQLAKAGSSGISLRARELLGLYPNEADLLFGFRWVRADGAGPHRHPTFEELCERVDEVTGIKYKPLTHLTEADYAG